MLKKRYLLPYLAGIFDGEGCIGITKIKPQRNAISKNPTYTVYMQVGMTDEIAPRLFHMTFGGGFYFRRIREGNRKPSYIWMIRGNNCKTVVEDLLPYILIKKPQFELALHFFTLIKPWGYYNGLTDEDLALREVDYLLSRKFNQRGKVKE